MDVYLPDESYLEGLRENDAQLLEAVFANGLARAVAAVQAIGGNQPDAALMFQVAILEIAKETRQTALPIHGSFLTRVTDLTLAHYIDWRAERGLAPTGTEPDYATDELPLPVSEQLRSTRRQYVAWSKYAKLGKDCQATLFKELGWSYYQADRPADPPLHSEAFQTCLARYQESLGHSVTEGIIADGLPIWATEAILDAKGYDLWQKIQSANTTLAEQRVQVQQKAQKRSNWIIIGSVLGLLLAYWLYTWYTRPPTTAVYKDNFALPESMVANMQARYSQLAADDSTTIHIADCEQLFSTADAFYQQKQYGAAASELETLLENDEQSPCRSDALFYLGVIALQLNQPQYTLASFAKIEDLQHFGEDIYWYQALAFVKMAEQDPTTQDRAVHALQRAIGNIQDTARREQAQRMLDKFPH